MTGWHHRRSRRYRIRAVLAAVAAVAAGLFLAAAPPASAAGVGGAGALRLGAIQPGRHPVLHVKTPVHVVFVGYQPKAVDVHRILSQLPAQGDPDLRSPSVYGLQQDVGLRYDYSYDLRFAGKAFDDAFFGYLGSSGVVAGISYFQTYYNEELHNDLDVGPKNRYIDATATEAWLEKQSHLRLGIDPGQDTVFLINWYGRPDFQFHSFTHHAVDPDTGEEFSNIEGALTRGWGGASGPTWFYDLSAGPVYSDVSWEVDDADLDGDGVMDYRIPPIWEYGNTTAFRPFTDLSGDLAKLIRYVAVDMLFAPSPLYDPAATVPGPDGAKQIDLDVFEGDPATNGLNDIQPAYIQAQHQTLEPYYDVTAKLTDRPLAGDVLAAYDNATGPAPTGDCLPQITVPEVVLYCEFLDHRAQYFPPAGDNAVVPVAGFVVPQLQFDEEGLTDDDWATGAPSFIYAFDALVGREFYGTALTQTIVHEVGHYVGLSHPHDGYDSASGVDFVQTGAYNYAWAGDASATVMSYTFGEETFDVFDRDNLARWQVARLLDLADSDTAAILAKPRTARIDLLLVKADAELTIAVAELHASDWIGAATEAVAGYRDVQRADAAAGVASAASKLTTANTAGTASPAAKLQRPVNKDDGVAVPRPLDAMATQRIPVP